MEWLQHQSWDHLVMIGFVLGTWWNSHSRRGIGARTGALERDMGRVLQLLSLAERTKEPPPEQPQ